MRKVKVLKYGISKPYKEGNKVYRDCYSLDECTNIINLGPFGISRFMKKVKSYKTEKGLMNYIAKNKINLKETITFEIK